MKKLALSLFFVFVSTLCWGEVIYLHNGGKIEGKIVEWREDTIIVQTKYGEVKVLRDKIKRIQKGESLEDIYKRKLSNLGRNDAHGYYLLGKWCQENGLKKEAKKCLKKAIEIAPSHAGAHKALGHKYYKGKWLPYDQYMKERGYVYYAGQWMTKAEFNNRSQGMIKFEGKWMTKKQFEELRKKRLLKLNWGYKKGGSSSSSSGTERRRPPKPIEVPDDLKELLKMAKSSHRDKRISAYKALREKGDKAIKLLRHQLMEEKEKKVKRIVNYFRNRGSRLIGKLGEELDKRRQRAVSFIMDPSKYPEANHGKAAQPQVDELVAAVRRVYKHPFKEVIPHSSKLKKMMNELKILIGDLRTYASFPESYDYEVEKLDKKISKAINMRKRFAPKGSFKILAYNKKVKTSMTDEERNCVKVTNEYRMMLGRRPLKIDEPLTQAARKHSADMKRQNYFSHTSKDGRSPAQRCAAEGATYYTGENIARGMTTGKAAFKAWYNSSGHHRNMLRRHISMGVGHHQGFWTENFGSSTSAK